MQSYLTRIIFWVALLGSINLYGSESEEKVTFKLFFAYSIYEILVDLESKAHDVLSQIKKQHGIENLPEVLFIDQGEKAAPNRYFFFSKKGKTVQELLKEANIEIAKKSTIPLVTGKRVTFLQSIDDVEGIGHVMNDPKIRTIKDYKKEILNSSSKIYEVYQNKSVTIQVMDSNGTFQEKDDEYKIKEYDHLKVIPKAVDKKYYFTIKLPIINKEIEVTTWDMRYIKLKALYKKREELLLALNATEKEKLGISNEIQDGNSPIDHVKNYINSMGEGFFYRWGSEEEYQEISSEAKDKTLEEAQLIKGEQKMIELFLPWKVKFVFQDENKEAILIVQKPNSTLSSILWQAKSKVGKRKGVSVSEKSNHAITPQKIPNPTDANGLSTLYVKPYSFYVENSGLKFLIDEMDNIDSLDKLNQHLTERIGSRVNVYVDDKMQFHEIIIGTDSFTLEKNKISLSEAGIQNGGRYKLQLKGIFRLQVRFPNIKNMLITMPNSGIKATSTVEKLYEVIQETWKQNDLWQSSLKEGSVFLGNKKIPNTTQKEKMKTLKEVDIENGAILTVFEKWTLNVYNSDQKKLIEIPLNEPGKTLTDLQKDKQYSNILQKHIVLDSYTKIVPPTDNLDIVLPIHSSDSNKDIFLCKGQDILVFSYDKMPYIIDTLTKDSTIAELVTAIGKQKDTLKNKGLLIKLYDNDHYHYYDDTYAESLNYKEKATIENLFYNPMNPNRQKCPLDVEVKFFMIIRQYQGRESLIKVDTLQLYNTLNDLLLLVGVNMDDHESVFINDEEYSAEALSQTLHDSKIFMKNGLTIFPSYYIRSNYTDDLGKIIEPGSSRLTKVKRWMTTFEEVNELINKDNKFLLTYKGKLVKKKEKLPGDLSEISKEIYLAPLIELAITCENVEGVVATLNLKPVSPFDSIEQILDKVKEKEPALKELLSEAILFFTIKNRKHQVGTSEEDRRKNLAMLEVDSGVTEVTIQLPITITFRWKGGLTGEEIVLSEKKVGLEKTFRDLFPKLEKADHNLFENSVAFEFLSKNGKKKRVGLNERIESMNLGKKASIEVLQYVFEVTCKWKNESGVMKSQEIPYLTENTTLGYLKDQIEKIDDLQGKECIVSWVLPKHKQVYHDLKVKEHQTLKELEMIGQPIEVITTPFLIRCKWDFSSNGIYKAASFQHLDPYMTVGSMIKRFSFSGYANKELAFFTEDGSQYLFSSNDTNKMLQELGPIREIHMKMVPNSFEVALKWTTSGVPYILIVQKLKVTSNLHTIWKTVQKSNSLKGKEIYYSVVVNGEENRFNLQNHATKSLEELNLIKPYASSELKIAIDTFTVRLKWQENNQDKSILVKGLTSELPMKYLFNQLKKVEYFHNKELTLVWGVDQEESVITEERGASTMGSLGIVQGTEIEVDLSRFTLEVTWQEEEKNELVRVSGLSKSDTLEVIFEEIKNQNNVLQGQHIGIFWRENEETVRIDPTSDLTRSLEEVGITSSRSVTLEKDMFVLAFTYEYGSTKYDIQKKAFPQDSRLKDITDYLQEEATIAPDSMEHLVYSFEKNRKIHEIHYKEDQNKTLKTLGIDENTTTLQVTIRHKSTSLSRGEKIGIIAICCLLVVGIVLAILRKQVGSLFFLDSNHQREEKSEVFKKIGSRKKIKARMVERAFVGRKNLPTS